LLGKPLDEPLVRLLEKNNLSGYEKQFEDFCLPCVEGSTSDATPLPGQSKLGGIPETPEDFQWPMYKGTALEFLCQINCQQINSELYPSTGMLSVFYIDNAYASKYEENGIVKVAYFPDIIPLVPFKPPQVEKQRLFGLLKPKISPKLYPQAALIFRDAVSLPDPDSLPQQFLADMEEMDECESYWEIKAELIESRFIQIGGFPNPVQYDGIAESIAKMSQIGTAEEWKMILELDSHPAMDIMWGDVGKIHIFAHSKDIESREYKNIWLEYQCH